MIIGLTGSFCGGKDTVGDYLKEKGFMHISLSDILREDLKAKKKKVTRENLQKIGNELREKHGNSVLAERVLKKLIVGKDYVITSIRHPDEVNALKKKYDFHLVKVDAPLEVRFLRMKKREREEDPQTIEEFKAMEELEMTGQTGSGQRIGECMSMASIVLMNDSDVYTLMKKVDKMVADLKIKTKPPVQTVETPSTYKRPSWDEYFINIMNEIGKRGSCDRGRSGALIVKDKRILCTGYVGSPPGLPHCDEVGHLMKKVIDDDGTVRQHCMRTIHAEQNAMLQAAKNGISIQGGTVYCKMAPCRVCAMMIISTGIKRVVAHKMYQAAQESTEMFK